MFGFRPKAAFVVQESRRKPLHGFDEKGQIAVLDGTIAPIKVRGRRKFLTHEVFAEAKGMNGPEQRVFLSDGRSIARYSGIDCDRCVCRASATLDPILLTGTIGANVDLMPEDIHAAVNSLPTEATIVGASDRWLALMFDNVSEELLSALATLSPHAYGTPGSDERKAMLRDFWERRYAFLVWW